MIEILRHEVEQYCARCDHKFMEGIAPKKDKGRGQQVKCPKCLNFIKTKR